MDAEVKWKFTPEEQELMVKGSKELRKELMESKWITSNSKMSTAELMFIIKMGASAESIDKLREDGRI